jgi:hypothetical protein
MALDARELIGVLEAEGFYPEPYSGRAMFGQECVSIQLEDEGRLWDLANRLGRNGVKISAPRLDSLGRDIVAYWPSAEWVAPAAR